MQVYVCKLIYMYRSTALDMCQEQRLVGKREEGIWNCGKYFLQNFGHYQLLWITWPAYTKVILATLCILLQKWKNELEVKETASFYYIFLM